RFVKADVEGGEREVLDGARATIVRDRPIILLETPPRRQRSARASATRRSSSSAASRSRHCRRSPPSARIRAGGPTSSRAMSYSYRDEAGLRSCWPAVTISQRNPTQIAHHWRKEIA